ncbi:MAG: hypothetical protein ACRD9S_06190 [Pyrinomonadaceae bacterium]
MHSLHRIRRRLGRIVSVLVFVCVLTVTANAYTVIMRGGKRIEIPSSFIVTTSTLTYEVSPGVQITLNLAAIDISATEIANNELPGSLLRRVPAASTESSQPADKNMSAQRASTSTSTRTITNRDLESAMRRRRESELTYERRRKELGLPSVEESRREAATQSDSITRELEQTRASESESENYWRERATALRTEIAAVDAEIRYVRSQLDEPLYSGGGSFINVGSVVPFVSFGNTGRQGPFSSRPMRPRVFASPRAGAQLSGRVVFGGGATRGQVFLNPRRFGHSRQFGLPLFASSNISPVISQPYDISYERSQLITRFNELGAARAGLNARWRELEEEARRAGAPPGWLRP